MKNHASARQAVLVCSALLLLGPGCHDSPELTAPSLGPTPARQSLAALDPVQVSLPATPRTSLRIAMNYSAPFGLIAEVKIEGFTQFSSASTSYYSTYNGDLGPNGLAYGNNGCTGYARIYFWTGGYRSFTGPGDCVRSPDLASSWSTVIHFDSLSAYRGEELTEPYWTTCSPACHTYSGSQTVTVTPLPADLETTATGPSQTVASKTVFVPPYSGSYPPHVTFLDSSVPRTMSGVQVPMWNRGRIWRRADPTFVTTDTSTFLSCNDRQCTGYIRESGTLVSTSQVNGVLHTDSASVECLTSPNDPVLDNAALRRALLAALDTSNVDSLPGAGFDPTKMRGWKHEAGGPIFKMSDSTDMAFFLPSADSIGTECLYVPDLHPALPQGAVRLLALFHTHVTEYNAVVFGCPEEGKQRFAMSPADTLPTANPRLPYGRSRIGTNGGGSNADWNSADSAQIPVYVVQKGGMVWRLDPDVGSASRPSNTNHWLAFGGRCQWLK